MILQLKEKIEVIGIFKDGLTPYKIKWNGREYKILKFGYHHKIHAGNVIHHIFSVATNSLAFRLNFNTDNLIWTLEEVSDGLAD